jgi:hypothetical protein
MRVQPMIIDRLVNTQMPKIQTLIQTLFGIKANLVMCSMRNHGDLPRTLGFNATSSFASVWRSV